MSNATVSSQVYIVRNASTLAAVSTGTMILYADGAHLFAKDANGNVYNLCTPSGSNITMALNDLSDATISSPSNGQILHYQSNQWVNVNPQTALAEILALADLSDVHNSTPTNGQALVWSQTNNRWEPGTVTSSGSVAALNDIGNVAITSVATGQTIVWNNSTNQWENGTVMSSFDIVSGSTTVNVDTTNDDFTLSGGTGITITPTASSRTFSFAVSADTDDISEGTTNLYYTDARVSSHLNTGSASANQILSWNGTDFAWVADQTGSGGGASAGNQYQIQIADASNGFAAANWSINSNSMLLPSTSVTYDVGGPSFATRRVFVGAKASNSADDGGLYLAKATNASQLTDYAKICTDGTHGDLYFSALPDNNNYHYYLEANDGSVEFHMAGGNSYYWTLKTDSMMNQSQTLKLPQSMGTAGQVLALSGISGDNADLDWTTVANGNQTLKLNVFSISRGFYSLGSSFPVAKQVVGEPIVATSGPTILGNSETWQASGGTADGFSVTMIHPIHKDGSATIDVTSSNIEFFFSENGSFSTSLLATGQTISAIINIHAYTDARTVGTAIFQSTPTNVALTYVSGTIYKLAFSASSINPITLADGVSAIIVAATFYGNSQGVVSSGGSLQYVGHELDIEVS